MRICMVSDFFYPSIGGVEEHVYNLSENLLWRGHKVVVLTHAYGDCKGVRYLTNGLKVYYLPIKVFYNQCVLPTAICNLPLIRCVLLRECIEVVHGHSAFSALAMEALIVGTLLNLKTVFTDHSLFGFADLSAVFTNKVLALVLSCIDHCICVSHIGKENTVLRAGVHTTKVSVVPNAVDTASFTPEPSQRPSDGSINVVVASRLVYRKGIDLLAGVIARFRNTHDVQFIIAGDGPKRELLEELRDKLNMTKRIEILGAVPHAKVRDVLVRGHIFVNTSLTEAYCMAIVEAAACGLQVVSTCVGGIPEVLPPALIILVEPQVESIHRGLLCAIQRCKQATHHVVGRSTNVGLSRYPANGAKPSSKRRQKLRASTDMYIDSSIYTTPVLCPYRCNEIVSELYSWQNVAKRTERVYRRAETAKPKSLGEILNAYLQSGVWPFTLVIGLCYLILQFLDWWRPSARMEKACLVRPKSKRHSK